MPGITPTTHSLHQRLRADTAELHRLSERAVAVDAVETVDAYIRLLEGYHGLYARLEPAIAARLPEIDADAGGRAHRKLSWLRADLRHFGLADADLQRLPLLPHPAWLGGGAEALGAAYVLEGATLGGSVVARVFGDRFGLVPRAGLRFFHGYGAQTRSRWKTFLAFLETRARDEDVHAAVIGGAERTFEEFIRWFGVRKP